MAKSRRLSLAHDKSCALVYSKVVRNLVLRYRHISALFALCLSAALLIGAWIFEHGLGYAPCTMCYWQRDAHKAVIILALCALIMGHFKPAFRKPLLAFVVLALGVSAFIAFKHMGVEYGWWDGPKACTTGGLGDFKFDAADPLAGLDNPIKPPACDEAVWHFMGLSMAAWNGILSLVGALALAVLMTYRGRDEQ